MKTAGKLLFGAMLAGACLAASGCHSRHLVLATGTTIGLKTTFAAGPEGRLTPKEVALAYKRAEFVSIPVQSSGGGPDLTAEELPSVVAASDMNAANFLGIKLQQVIATGAAADALSTGAAGQLLEVFRDDEVKKKEAKQAPSLEKALSEIQQQVREAFAAHRETLKIVEDLLKQLQKSESGGTP